MNAALAGLAALPDDALLLRNTRRALTIALLRAREVVMGRFPQILASHDVTEPERRVIRVLGEESPLDATEVADRACVLAPSLTRIIRALEDRKMITRARDVDDGGRACRTIAPAGLALIREVTPETSPVYAELEAHYG